MIIQRLLSPFLSSLVSRLSRLTPACSRSRSYSSQVRVLQASHSALEAKSARLERSLEAERAERAERHVRSDVEEVVRMEEGVRMQELQMLRKENAQLRSAAAVAEQEIYRSLQVDGFVPRYAHRHAYPI